MNNKPYLLAFNRMNGIGPCKVKALLARWPSLQTLFSLSYQEKRAAGLPEVMAKTIHQFNFSVIEDDLKWEMEPDHHLLSMDDPLYPPLLKEIHDPPLVLYAKGDLSCFKQHCIAMVGTRKPSITGSETARLFAQELGGRGLTIVSGLALGIDAQAHSGCLAAKGKTIAVLGTGIDTIYPKRHLALAMEIAQQGLILSEFPLRSQPIAGHFPRRNRIISGLSLATLVIEAAIRSGSLITAQLALEQNREVMALPGSIRNPQARGCHHLLQQGATLVTSANDVLGALGLGYHEEIMNDPYTSLATNDKNLVKFIGFEITTVDQLIIRTGLSVEEVACNLAALELQGIVKAVPGGYMRHK